MRIVVGADHAGVSARVHLVSWLRRRGHEVFEVGAPTAMAYDYPLAADQAVAKIRAGAAEYGVLICGTGIGMAIRANRYIGIRAANCTDVLMARAARSHNHANVLCLGARTLEEENQEAILESDQDPRHERRVEELDHPMPGMQAVRS
ncbi:MAG: RpiB/LacA/LacB family sugar-phosphate isomerase [Fimbriimonas ginsengisoli]|nr:RpiB/LacA/LacB family sugar-phosphate isomerase [Fimbriimonas ginsengisoli]